MYGTAPTEATLPVYVKIEKDVLSNWIALGNPKDPWEQARWDVNTIALAVERVNRGAALLDRENPTWMDHVVPGRLMMQNGSFCIIGQVYGEYDEHVGVPFGMDVLDMDDENYDIPKEISEQATEHGFFANGVPFPLLDQVWVYLLEERAERGASVYLALLEQS